MRGKGIGSLLLLSSEDIARSEGIPAIFLYTALSNEAVSSFYLNRGFEIDSIDLTRQYPRGLFVKSLN
jgi:ribosomal protein S18 acetylase RimI-like enzyme